MTTDDRPSPRQPRSTTVAVGALLMLGIVALAIIAFALSSQGGTSEGTPTPPASSTTAPPLTQPSTSPGASGAPASPASSVDPGRSATPGASASPGRSSPPAATPTYASPAPSDDPILAGMLQAEDLPGLTDPLGPQEGTDYDIDDAAFDAHGGIRVTSRVWQASGNSGPTAVFDFRMQFPSDDAAAAYLTDAEPILSESAATGQRPVPSPPVIGSDGRVYGLETTGAEGSVLLRTYLFRVGPVVAKVVVGGPQVSASDADAIARAAAARMEAAGPPPTGTPRPTAPPTSTPAPTQPLPTGDLSSLLLAHIPDPIAAGCDADDQRLWQGEVATLVCTDVDQGVTVTYSGFVDVPSLQAAYEDSLASLDISEVAAACDLGTYTAPYRVDGDDVGQITCWSEQGGRAIMWSDERLAILSVAVTRSLDSAGLYLWWLAAGPTL